jgi:iron complex outermembrane receptor protein
MEPLVFKRWTNKRWAAFASLHRVIVIGTLCFSYQMLAQEAPEQARDSSHTQLKITLEEVEATGLLPGELEESGLRPVVVVSSREMEKAAAGSHEEVLEYLPGLDIRQRGKFGTQADLSIQGGTFDQSMILLNGINLSDPQTGHFHLNLPLGLHAIHQMEVLNGSATRHFGTHAFSGAVNVVTDPADSTSFRFGLGGGQYGLYRAHALLNMAGKAGRSLISAGSTGSTGYRENTDFRNHQAYLHWEGGNDTWQLALMGGGNRRAFGANAFYSPRFPLQYEEVSTGFTAVKVHYFTGSSRWTFRAYYRVTRDHFLLDRQDPEFYMNDHLSQVLGTELDYRVSWLGGVTRAGLRYRREALLSSSLGETLAEPVPAPFRDSLLFPCGIARNLLNGNLNHRWETGPLSLSGGFLAHMDPAAPSGLSIYPGLDMRLSLGPALRFHASANRSMRLPTFTDLYYQGPSNVGNPDLLPEKALTFEGGLTYLQQGWQLGIQGFYREGRQLIDWVWMEDERWHTMNFSEVNALGSTLHVHYSNPERYTGSFWQVLERLDMSYSFAHLTRVSEQLNSRYLLDQLKHKFVLGATFRAGRRLDLSWNINMQDRNGSYLAYDPGTGQSEELPYEPFMLLDLKLRIKVWKLLFYGECSNLFNTPYHDIGNVPQPGRWIIGGVELHL